MVTDWVRSKLTIGLAAILACALAWGAIQTWRVGNYRADLEATETALSEAQANVEQLRATRRADARVIDARAVQRQEVYKQEGKERDATISALEANQDWASQPVPDDVLSSLR